MNSISEINLYWLLNAIQLVSRFQVFIKLFHTLAGQYLTLSPSRENLPLCLDKNDIIIAIVLGKSFCSLFYDFFQKILVVQGLKKKFCVIS